MSQTRPCEVIASEVNPRVSRFGAASNSHANQGRVMLGARMCVSETMIAYSSFYSADLQTRL